MLRPRADRGAIRRGRGDRRRPLARQAARGDRQHRLCAACAGSRGYGRPAAPPISKARC
ncbi:MAG: hypothetical protein MZV49_01130 [Rhodopseudomonas palustris]|nr:hypothetical protein [Rhodopseudomonas palustris]